MNFRRKFLIHTIFLCAGLFLGFFATPLYGAAKRDPLVKTGLEQLSLPTSAGSGFEFRPLSLDTDLSDAFSTNSESSKESDDGDSGEDRKKEDKPKKNIILILNGTSSSGKSTHAKDLMKHLGKTWICQAIDDLDDKDVDDEDDDSKLMPENILMVERIEELVSKGFNVLVDTVLDDSGEYKNFHKALHNLKVLKSKLREFTILTVIVYCPPADLEQRVKTRSATPDDDDRTLSQSLGQFGAMYKASDHSSPVVDRIKREDIDALRASPVLFRREPSGSDQVDRLITAVLNDLGFKKGVDSVAISPRQSYDLIVNSRDGIESNVKKILALIDKKS